MNIVSSSAVGLDEAERTSSPRHAIFYCEIWRYIFMSDDNRRWLAGRLPSFAADRSATGDSYWYAQIAIVLLTIFMHDKEGYLCDLLRINMCKFVIIALYI